MSGIIIAAIVVLVALLFWINRPVTITIDDKETQVRIGSTITEVFEGKHIDVDPGNYISVTERVLAKGSGHPFCATVNGNALAHEDEASYCIEGGETITFEDGDDIMEGYSVVTEPIAPYLAFYGTGTTIQFVSQWGMAGELEHRTGNDSGERVDVETKEAVPCIVTCSNFNLEGDRKYVALTFDDGPSSPYTEQYLDILERYGVRATFFFLGESVEQNPELARKVVEAGHQVANHTMAHNQLTAVDGETVRAEVRRSAEVIERDCGVATTHLRPPYGDFTERSWLATGGDVSASVRWSGDSEDWRLPGADAIVENALVNVHSGTVILMHDGGGDRSQDVEALPRLIERLQGDGYEFVTVSDLMRAAGDIPEDVCSGSAAMPEGCTWPDEIAPEGYLDNYLERTSTEEAPTS